MPNLLLRVAADVKERGPLTFNGPLCGKQLFPMVIHIPVTISEIRTPATVAQQLSNDAATEELLVASDSGLSIKSSTKSVNIANFVPKWRLTCYGVFMGSRNVLERDSLGVGFVLTRR